MPTDPSSFSGLVAWPTPQAITPTSQGSGSVNQGDLVVTLPDFHSAFPFPAAAGHRGKYFNRAYANGKPCLNMSGAFNASLTYAPSGMSLTGPYTVAALFTPTTPASNALQVLKATPSTGTNWFIGNNGGLGLFNNGSAVAVGGTYAAGLDPDCPRSPISVVVTCDNTDTAFTRVYVNGDDKTSNTSNTLQPNLSAFNLWTNGNNGAYDLFDLAFYNVNLGPTNIGNLVENWHFANFWLATKCQVSFAATGVGGAAASNFGNSAAASGAFNVVLGPANKALKRNSTANHRWYSPHAPSTTITLADDLGTGTFAPSNTLTLGAGTGQQSVTSYTPASPGPRTITASGSGLTSVPAYYFSIGTRGTQAVAVNDSNIIYSPGNWNKNGSTWVQTNCNGAYLRMGVPGRSLWADFDMSLAANTFPADQPYLKFRVNGGAWVDIQLTAASNGFAFMNAGAVSNSSQTVNMSAALDGQLNLIEIVLDGGGFYQPFVNNFVNGYRYGTTSGGWPNGSIRITGFHIDQGCSLQPIRRRPKNILFYTASAGEGWGAGMGVSGTNGIPAFNAPSCTPNAPLVSFSGGGGSGAAAYATVGSNGTVNGYVVTKGGSGYTSAPTATATGGSGTLAAPGTVTVTANVVTAVALGTAGSGYGQTGNNASGAGSTGVATTSAFNITTNSAVNSYAFLIGEILDAEVGIVGYGGNDYMATPNGFPASNGNGYQTWDKHSNGQTRLTGAGSTFDTSFDAILTDWGYNSPTSDQEGWAMCATWAAWRTAMGNANPIIQLQTFNIDTSTPGYVSNYNQGYGYAQGIADEAITQYQNDTGDSKTYRASLPYQAPPGLVNHFDLWNHAKNAALSGPTAKSIISPSAAGGLRQLVYSGGLP